MKPSEPPFRLGYRPYLDGMRGVAILLVLLDHGGILGSRSFGFIGVNTFFVLSGFLITCLLVEEFDSENDISFRRFYLRRALRLLPALTAMLLLFVLFSFLNDPPQRAVREFFEALSALFYYENWAEIYHFGRHFSLTHTWSLSVEEQFYIIWPGILLFMLSRTSRSSMLCWIILGAFLAALFRVGLLVGGTTSVGGNVFSTTDNPHRLMCGTDTRADSLLLGCFAGIVISSNMLPRKVQFKKLLKITAMVSGPGLLALAAPSAMQPIMVCFGWLSASVLAMVLIIHLVSANQDLLHRCLECRFLVFTGQISYGLYVWHFPILKAMAQHQLPWRHMTYLLVAVPVTLASYYLIEKPCLKLKTKFQVVR